MWGDILTRREVEYCERLRKQLAGVRWVRPLLNKIPPTPAISSEDKPLLFELRFAAAIHARGLEADYEADCGMAGSTVDFGLVANGTQWRVDLVSIATSEAVKRATISDGFYFQTKLSTNADDPRESEEGEILLVQQKIGEKVVRGDKPTKFPMPSARSYHVILADMCGFALTGGDKYDYREIAYGAPGLHGAGSVLRHFWKNQDDTSSPILGIFDERNTMQRGARFIRERIHLLGFCWDERYESGSLVANSYYLGNPALFDGDEAAEAVYRDYPLRLLEPA